MLPVEVGGEGPAVDVAARYAAHGRSQSSSWVSQLLLHSPVFQHPEFCVYDLLDGAGIKEFGDVTSLSHHK